MIEIKQNDDKDLDSMNIGDGMSENENPELIEEERNKPLEKKVISTIWKIRKEAYNEFISILREIKNPEDVEELLNKIPIVKFLDDPFPTSVEAALDALIYLYKNFTSNIKEDISKEIFRLTIEKAYACSKTPVKIKSKELITVILETSNSIYTYYEVLKKILVFTPKRSKTVLFGEQILNYLITEYGCENFDYKFFIPSVMKLIEGGNLGVRNEAYEIVKQIYKWVRGDLIPELKPIKDAHMKDLRKDFDKLDENDPNVPQANRSLKKCERPTEDRENVPKETKVESKPIEKKIETPIVKDTPKVVIEEIKSTEINKEEYFTTPISSVRNSFINEYKNTIFLLETYNEDWVNNLLSKDRKWMEKKDFLEEFAKNVNNSKVGDYVDGKLEYLFFSFKILLKDTNINVVLSTLSAINSLAQQLSQSFSPYVKEYLPIIFEKFKEKKDKLNKEIIVTLSNFLKCNINLDDIIPLLSNLPNDKSNQFKLNICEFLLISMRKTYKNILKKVAKDLLEIFLKLSDEQNIEIRNTALSCIALLKVRLADMFNRENLLGDINDNKRIKIDELLKTTTYDKLYDVEQIIEKVESPKIKINRKSSISNSQNNLNTEENYSPPGIKAKGNLKEREQEMKREKEMQTEREEEMQKEKEKQMQKAKEREREDNQIIISNKTIQSSPPIKPSKVINTDAIKTDNEYIPKTRSKDSTQTNNKPLNVDDIPLYATTTKAVNLDKEDNNEEDFPAKNKQADLDEFARMLEEAMKKESQNKTDNSNSTTTPARTVVKKAIVTSRKTEGGGGDDDDDSKLNKDEIEDRINNYIGDEAAVLLQSSKWDEKKNGLMKLNEWINENIEKNINLIQSNVENLIVYLKVKLKDFKEANFHIIREATNSYISLIRNFSGKAFDKKFSIGIIKGLSEKLGDPKLKENISNLLFEMMENQGPKYILINIIKIITNEKKPAGNSALKEYSSLFEKAIDDFTINFIPVKDMVEFCKFLANNTNPQVRNASTSLLCVLYKYVGKDLKVLLKDIKESTLKIIETELDKVTVETVAQQPKRELKQNALKEEGISLPSKMKGSTNISTAAASNLMDSLIPRVDISKKITAKMLKDIADGKWPEKKEACEALEKILNDANMKILPNGLNDLFATIKGRLSDGNKNVVRLIVNILGKIIDAVGSGFKPFTKIISTPLINNLSDKQQMLREDVLVCMDKWVTQCGLDTIILYIPAILKQENFEMRTELFKFLHKYKESFVFLKDKFDLREFVSPLLSCLQDKAASVRASAEELIAYSLKFVPLSNYMNGLKDFKTAIANTLKQILEKYRGINAEDGLDIPVNNSVVLKTVDTKKSQSNNTVNQSTVINNEKGNTPLKNNNSDTFSKADSQKKIATITSKNDSKKTLDKKGKNDKKNEDDLASNSVSIKSNSTIINSNKNLTTSNKDVTTGKSPRIVSNKKVSNLIYSIFIPNPNLKTTKEKRLEIDKKYKFNLETLNEDFVTKLKDAFKFLFTTEFMTKMFHDDIKFNIEAMNLIQAQIKEGENSINLNFNLSDYLDLILKWIGWKCNNNQNPSLVKTMLDFLEALCDRVEIKEITLNETEGYIVIALLIDKLGVNNSKIKEITRNLMERWLDKISGRFGHLVNISAGKNSKVKVDCIEICSNLIVNNGASIASNKDLKFLSKMLSTNDNNLKNSLINLFSQVYIQIQENLWNILNDTPDKIKEMLYNSFYSSGLIKDEDEDAVEEQEEEQEEEEAQEETQSVVEIKQTEKSFKDKVLPQTLRESANASMSGSSSTANYNNNKANAMPLSNAQSHVTINKIGLDQDNSKKKGSHSDDNLIHVQNEKNVTYDKENMNSNHSNFSSINSITVTDRDSLLQILNNLNYGEISERVNVIVIIHELVCVKFDQSKSVLIPNIDNIIKAFIISLKNLFENKNLNEIPIKLGKYLLTVLHKISSNKELIKNISYDVLYELSEEVLSNLLIENLEKVGENQEGVVIVRSLNSTMLRVLENCNFTHVISVLLELVKKYRKSQVKVKISNLAIKCLLKINQILSQIIDLILVDKVLVKIHELLVDFEESYPDLNASNQTDQTVIRYIKNLISELVKLRKEAIISDYTRGVEKHPKKDNHLKKWIKNILSSLSGITSVQSNSNFSNTSKEEKNTINSPISNLKDTSTQNNIDNLIAYKNKLQQNNKTKSPLNDSARMKQPPIQNSSASNSPMKRPRNSEMYNKIMNLKSKLANFNNSTISHTHRNEENKALSKTFIENTSSPDYFNSTYIQDNSNKPIMTKINELKKKWNDVSSKNKNVTNFSLSPDNTPDKSKGNIDESNQSMNDRMNEIKSKYNMTKIKNVNINQGSRK